MNAVEKLVWKIRRAETPFYQALKRYARALMSANPPVPSWSRGFWRFVYDARWWTTDAFRRIACVLYRYPVFHSRCESIGKRVMLEQVPSIGERVRVYIGDDVVISGVLSVSAGSIVEQPEFRVGNRVFLGHLCAFSVAKEIVIEDDVLIAGDCIVSDYSGHPLNAEERAAGAAQSISDVKPVRICRKAWIGRRAIILPGVTIGEGAIVGAGTVVTKDVPPYQLCVGNPGRIVARTGRYGAE